MAADTQTHHVLPNAIYINFARDIAKWTGFDYSQNAGYNLIQLPKDTSGAAVQAANCSIPDDHIASRRSALFMARSVLTAARERGQRC